MEKQEKKLRIGKKVFNPSLKLNNMKVYMAYLEWYKKSSKDKEIGYYDFHKNYRYDKRNMDVVEFRIKLTNYWMDTVEEAEKKPQEDGAAFRIRWVFGGNTYRKMVEPLCIAEYYREHGQKDYEEGRDEHFKLLENWLDEAEKEARPPTDEELNKKLEAKKKNVASILTEDSCFWAKVEEAIRLLKNEELKAKDRESWEKKLKKFEEHVMDLLEKYEGSSEIFLKDSSFMQWWREKETMGSSYPSLLYNFMRAGRYRNYAEGKGI